MECKREYENTWYQKWRRRESECTGNMTADWHMDILRSSSHTRGLFQALLRLLRAAMQSTRKVYIISIDPAVLYININSGYFYILKDFMTPKFT